MTASVLPTLPTQQGPVRLLLQWQQPTDPMVTATRIYRWDGLEDGDDAAWNPVGDFPGDRTVIESVTPTRGYRFAAAPVLQDGSVPPEAGWAKVEVYPDSNPDASPLPDTVTNFGCSQNGPRLHFMWDPNDDGRTVGYELRQGSAWGDGLLVGRTPHPWWDWNWNAAGTIAYTISAFDARGRYGAATLLSPSMIVVALPDHVLSNTYDESGGGFTGTKVNTEVSGGNLRLLALPIISSAATLINAATFGSWARYWDTGTYETSWKDFGALMTQRFEIDLAAAVQTEAGLTIADLITPILTPVQDSAGNAITPGTRGYGYKYTVNGVIVDPFPILVEIDTSQNGTPTADGYRRFVPGEYKCWQARFRITLYGDGLHYGRITTLKFYRRRRNLKDEIAQAVAATPGPTVIAFATPFTAAPKVVAAVLDAAGTEFIAQAADITATGCNVRAYDAAGAEVFTGTVHVIAAGV